MDKSLKYLKAGSPYSGVLTREQFLFYETRTTAKLLDTGLTEAETQNKIVQENLFQYPTEKSIRKMADTCIRRVQALDDILVGKNMAWLRKWRKELLKSYQDKRCDRIYVITQTWSNANENRKPVVEVELLKTLIDEVK